MSTVRTRPGWLPVLLLLLAAAACNSSKDTGGGPPPGPTPAEVLAALPGGDEYAAGKKVYADQNCARCHKLGDIGPLAGKGPDLTRTGAEPTHTKPWLADQVRNPLAHNAKSLMPASGPDKIPDPELDALAAYLASRK